MRILSRILVVLVVLLKLNSCVNADYDLKNVDMSVQIGGDSLAFPIGKTDTIRVNALMDALEVDMIKVHEDGSYALSMIDTVDFAKSMPDFTKAIVIKGALDYSEPLTLPQDFTPLGRATPAFNYKLAHKVPVEINLHGAKDIRSLDTVMIENAFLQLGFDLNLPSSNVKMKMEIQFPKSYIFKKGGRVTDKNIYETDVTLFNGVFIIDPPLELFGLDFVGKDFGGDVGTVFEDTIIVKCEISPGGIDSPPSNLGLLLTASMTDFSPVYANGVVDLAIDDTRQTLSLEGIPEFMRSEDCVLDMMNPYILVELTSNAGLPVKGDLTLVPYVNGLEVADARQKIKYELPVSSSPNIIKNVKYWIAQNNRDCPDDYEFREYENLPEVFRKIPDSIVILMDGRLDVDQDHIIDFKANYQTNATYELAVPFSFGQDFHVMMADTISNVSPVLSDMLNDAGLELFGEIENSLPLQLELKMSALDDNNNVVPLRTTTSNIIEPGSSIGESVKSNIEFSLRREDTSKSKITTLIMTFTATSPNSSGVMIDEDDFLIADLKVKIPNGITINDKE